LLKTHEAPTESNHKYVAHMPFATDTLAEWRDRYSPDMRIGETDEEWAVRLQQIHEAARTSDNQNIFDEAIANIRAGEKKDKQ